MTGLDYRIEGRKIFLSYDGDVVKVIDKNLIMKDLPLFQRCTSLRELEQTLEGWEKKRVVHSVARLLAGRSYLSQKLHAKLIGYGFSATAADEGVAWAKRHQFLADDELTLKWIEGKLRKGYGLHWIIQGLRSQGMSLSILEERKESLRQEEAKIAASLYAKWISIYGKDRKGQLKVAHKMRQRGFSQIPRSVIS